MKDHSHLYILWTNGNTVTAEKMVFMYAINAIANGWWDAITLIIWGAPARLVSESTLIQDKVREAVEKGVHITACKACADQLEVTGDLKKLGIEVKYWGSLLTEVIKNGEKLLTV